ncbi:unnamed protein product [Miscanthus lutarioriparius]|uniref:Uncharacterized protein n=1 Tax=Miscanthus lutarioriparius TaxID=422564 RepID=A0A811NA58_9POAL|nr:unnamed protein product [Miscanthus lutarioriparius]
MGACVSLSRSPPAPSTAEASHSQRTAAATVKVVNLDGSMAQLAGPVTAREALAPGDGGGGRQRHHRVSSPPPRVFLCSADELGYDAPPRALAAGEALQPGQLYFVLPASALRRPLAAKDMAALAVRAATALAAAAGLSPRRDKQGGTTAAGKRRRRRQATARVAPLLVAVSRESPPDGGYTARPAVQEGERTVVGGQERELLVTEQAVLAIVPPCRG